MTILEKNNIKMNLRTTEQEDFDLLLNNEKEKFERDFNKNYSQKFIEEYNLKFFDSGNYILPFVLGNVLSFFILYSLNFNSIPHSCRFPILIFLGLCSFCFHALPLLKPIKKLLNKMNSKKKKSIDIIKKDVFSNNVPDNYFLKKFIIVYGEKAMKDILMNKETITYGDIEYYIEKVKETKRQINKVKKVDEIVKCISALQ